MVDRHAAQPRRTTGDVPRNRNTASSVRRNLFRSQLTRRPTPASSGSEETLRLGSAEPQPEEETLSASSSSSSEIVVRDKNGDVELGNPPTPSTEEPDEVALDAQHEREKERQRLADAVKHHQFNHSVPAQPEELLEAVRASLRAKVAALAEDNWMYESEDATRHY